MAELTQYTGGAAQEGGITLSQKVVTEDEYDAILLVSDPDDSANYNPDSPDFDSNFAYTLYYIKDE